MPRGFASKFLAQKSEYSMGKTSQDPFLKLLLEAPKGKWVAFSSDETRIVAVGDTFSTAAAKAQELGESEPVVWPIPERWVPLSL
jgi:hypothetical protein